MENIAIVDAGPLIALFDNSDNYHHKVKQSIAKYRGDNQGRLITTWPIVTEVSYILQSRVHIEAQLDFLEWVIVGGVEMFNLKIDSLARVIELQKKYSNIEMDFADATLLVTAESLGISRVFSLDSDFSIYRLSDKKPFENVIEFT